MELKYTEQSAHIKFFWKNTFSSRWTNLLHVRLRFVQSFCKLYTKRTWPKTGEKASLLFRTLLIERAQKNEMNKITLTRMRQRVPPPLGELPSNVRWLLVELKEASTPKKKTFDSNYEYSRSEQHLTRLFRSSYLHRKHNKPISQPFWIA